MGRRQKAFNEFIDGIADEKLEGLSKQAGTIASDDNYRLDMQGMTSDGKHNLQVQVNKNAKLTSLKKLAPNTVATFICPDGTGAEEIRSKLKGNFQLDD